MQIRDYKVKNWSLVKTPSIENDFGRMTEESFFLDGVYITIDAMQLAILQHQKDIENHNAEIAGIKQLLADMAAM